MNIVEKILEVRTIRWQDPKLTWGLVPTMGALHDGHLALVRQALAENDCVAVSIFVNPLQFNQSSDLAAYPRQIEQDSELLEKAGVHLVWIPSVEEVYPSGFQTYVTIEKLTHRLEGAARPGHFKGVATIVTKLFNVIQPHRAYFGQKDAQQVVVIQQMVRDLAFNLDIVICPTLREADGLAMSSRNLRLNPRERQASTVLFRALCSAKTAWESGQHDAEMLRQIMKTIIDAEPLARIDYISVAHPESLEEIQGNAEFALMSMAVFIGNIRLIDNLILNV